MDVGQPYSLTRAGPEALPGASNYWLPVLSSRRGAGASREALRIWLLDSERVPCARLRRMGARCCERSIPRWLSQHVSLRGGPRAGRGLAVQGSRGYE